MTDLFSKIKEVTEIPAISGHEAPVRDYLRQQLTPHVDEIVTDGLGGIFGVKHSTAADAPRILVAAHMDEVGFMISEIKADGTLRVVPNRRLESDGSSAANASNSLHVTDVNTLLFQDLFLLI